MAHQVLTTCPGFVRDRVFRPPEHWSATIQGWVWTCQLPSPPASNHEGTEIMQDICKICKVSDCIGIMDMSKWESALIMSWNAKIFGTPASCAQTPPRKAQKGWSGAWKWRRNCQSQTWNAVTPQLRYSVLRFDPKTLKSQAVFSTFVRRHLGLFRSF